MAAPTTPQRSLLGRLVGSISRYVPTPKRTTPPNNLNASPKEAQPASTPDSTPAAPTAEAPQNPPATEEWYPGMIQSKYLSEMENMWDDIIKTPPRRPVRRPQTCPPRPRNTRGNTQGNRVEMPRSAMKKRLAPIHDEAQATPSNNKRVKFNETLTEERVLSPSQPGERDLVPEHHLSCNKKRPRATDPYAGKHFADSPNIFDDEPPSKKVRLETGDESTCDTDNTPTTQNNTNMNVGVCDAGYFVPNRTQPRPGTFELNYDTYGLADDYSSLSEEESNGKLEAEAEAVPANTPPSATTTTGRFALEFSDDSILPDVSTNSLLDDTTPTPGPSKPPTRTTSPPALESSTTQNEQETTRLEVADDAPPTPPTPPIPPNAAAIDAEMDALDWPKPVTYVEAGIASQHVIDLLKERYDKDDEYYAQLWWDREYGKFVKALDTAKAEGREIQVEF